MEIDKLHSKLVKGFFSLTFRKIALDAINFFTIFIFLAKILPVPVIGIYGIAQGILSFFTYFSDIGLGAALIQKKEIIKSDLQTTFLIQELIILSLTIIIWFSAPIFSSFYNFDEMSMWLIRALGVGFFLSSLKVIPSNLLERKLRFEPIVMVEIIETIVFNCLLIFLTLENYGISAFSYAVVARGVIGALLINILSPWNISIGFSKESAKVLFNFGVPFQLNSILAMLKDRLTPLITAGIVGNLGFGYLTWAQGIAYRPLEIMNVVIRVTFPAYSRVQDDSNELKRLIEKSLYLTVLMVYPLLFGMLAVIPIFIDYMDKEKFSPALPLIYLFAFSTFWAVPSTTFTNVLNAIGRVGITLKLMIMWTVLTWILSPLFALMFGYIGVAVASAIISFTSVIPIIIITRLLKVKIIENIWQPLVASIIMCIGVYTLSIFLPVNIMSILLLIIIGIGLYGMIVFLTGRSKFISSIKDLKDV